MNVLNVECCEWCHRKSSFANASLRWSNRFKAAIGVYLACKAMALVLEVAANRQVTNMSPDEVKKVSESSAATKQGVESSFPMRVLVTINLVVLAKTVSTIAGAVAVASGVRLVISS